MFSFFLFSFFLFGWPSLFGGSVLSFFELHVLALGSGVHDFIYLVSAEVAFHCSRILSELGLD